MEAGALFLRVLLAIVIAAAGFVVCGIAARLRQRQFHREGDKVEGPGGPAEPAGGERRARPEHVEVDSEQRTRFADSR
jgi:hypothetical protein